MSRSPGPGPFFAFLLLICLPAAAPAEMAATQPPPRAIVIGWDGAQSSLVQAMLDQKKLPNLAKLIAGGAFADEVLAVFPSKTAPGFASLWTGALPRETGISGNRQPRAPAHRHTILESHVSFLSAPLRAEPLWAVALRAGRKTVLAHVPLGRERSDGAVKLLGYDGYTGRDGVIHSRAVKLQPAAAWQDTPASAKPLLEMQFAVGASTFFGLFIDDPAIPEAGYDTLLVTSQRSGANALARLRPGAADPRRSFWSGPVEVRSTGNENATVYLRLFDLKPDAGEFLLYHTRPVRSMIFPAEFAAAHSAAAGPFIGNGASLLYQEGALGAKLVEGGDGVAEARYMETVRMVQRQLTKTALWAMTAMRWDLLLLYTPFPDEGEHLWRGYIDINDSPHSTVLRRFLEEVYRTSDDLLGEILAQRPENTVIAVVSDHGMEGVTKLIAINRVLERAGLLTLNDKGQPDLARTEVFYPPVNNGYLLINSTDRKNGIVTREERAGIVKRLSAALLGITDDGRSVISALYDSQTEGKALGIGGDAGGDIYLDPLPGYDFDPRTGPGEIITRQVPHGMHWFNPQRRSMRTIMVLNGPGVAGEKRLKNVRLIDFAPTLAKLMHLPAPKDASGRVLQEALQDPR